MDEVDELLIVVAVLQLVADVPQVLQVELVLCMGVQQGEVGSASFLGEGVSLT